MPVAKDSQNFGILLIGGDGQLGRHLAGTLATLGNLKVLGRQDLDLESDGLFKKIEDIEAPNLKVIVNAAAYTKVDKAETDKTTAFMVNAAAPQVLAEVAKKRKALLIHYSTDYVYGGDKDSPYTEDDIPIPINVYGESKLKGDISVMESGADYVILRTSWVYALIGKNFPHTILKLAKEKDSLEMDESQRGAPTSVELLSAVTNFIIGGNLYFKKNYQGLYHLTSSGECTWLEFSRFLLQTAQECGLDLKLTKDMVSPRDGPDTSRAATRPLNSRLSLQRFTQTFGIIPPHWTYHARHFVLNYKAFLGLLE